MIANNNKALHVLKTYPVSIGLFIRLLLAWLLPLLLDDGAWIPGVAYTDLDYHVFTQAAEYVAAGKSPYERHTYRYTPFLAALLAQLPPNAGRYLFCVADTLCGWILVRQRNTHSWKDALCWLYNPLAIHICTRGSAESLMVLLPVLLTIQIATRNDTNKNKNWTNAALAGVCHGIAVHSKLYPIIYTLAYMAYLANRSDHSQQSNNLREWIYKWTRRMLTTVTPWIFLFTAVLVFSLLTYTAVSWYGPQAWDQGFVYHLSRVDHRHNYSIFWYWIYLTAASSSQASMGLLVVGKLLLLPQALLLVLVTLGVAPYNLGLALFVQTHLFVALNKVLTAQYFTWYLCLLPLVTGIVWTRRLQTALLCLLLAIGLWLACAYCLEMLGLPVYRQVWMASLVFFAAHISVLMALLDAVGRPFKPKME